MKLTWLLSLVCAVAGAACASSSGGERTAKAAHRIGYLERQATQYVELYEGLIAQFTHADLQAVAGDAAFAEARAGLERRRDDARKAVDALSKLSETLLDAARRGDAAALDRVDEQLAKEFAAGVLDVGVVSADQGRIEPFLRQAGFEPIPHPAGTLWHAGARTAPAMADPAP